MLTLDYSKVESPHKTPPCVTVWGRARGLSHALFFCPESLPLQVGEQGRVCNSDPELENA